MSPPVLLNNSHFIDKKSAKHNQLKNSHTLPSKKNTEQMANDKMVTDLLVELQSLMTENAKLQNVNKTLKSAVTELQDKYTGLMESVQSNKSKFELDMNKLQDEIKNNEIHLLQNGKKCLQQQKMYIQEIKNLKAEIDKLQSDSARNENDLIEKINTLESEIKLLQINYDKMKTLNEENAQKSTKYKNKLKYAITIINDLNNMLIHCSAKPKVIDIETQTDDGRQLNISQSLNNTQSCTSSQPHNFETENLLLSEVFFRSKAFCDNELLLFGENQPVQCFD